MAFDSNAMQELEYMSRVLKRQWDRDQAMRATWELIRLSLDEVNGEIPF